MRIVVNDIAASPGGAMTVLKSFYKYLTETESAKEHEWIFLLSDRYLEDTDHIKIIVLTEIKRSWMNRLKFDIYYGKKYIAKLKPDILFSMQNTITFGVKCPQVLYMHQSLPFQKEKKFSFFKSKERILAIYQYLIGSLIKISIKKADKTIVQTNWIREAVIEQTSIPAEKVINVFPSLENYSEYKRDNQFNKQNFFYPASNYVYKNHETIYKASEILTDDSVENFNILLTIDSDSTYKNISFSGELSFKSVLNRYNTSTLIFPSYIETVGLPLIEARQLGAIILASDCSFSREVLNGYKNAYFFHPFKPKELANLMKKVLSGEIVKNEIIKEEIKIENEWDTVKDILIKIGKTKSVK